MRAPCCRAPQRADALGSSLADARTRARACGLNIDGPRVSRYRDFGEMFHHSGEIVDHLVVDNPMVPDHFPQPQALMQQRVRVATPWAGTSR